MKTKLRLTAVAALTLALGTGEHPGSSGIERCRTTGWSMGRI